MKIDDQVKGLLDKVRAGKLDKYLQELDGSDLGLHIPVYQSKGVIKPMIDGYSQSESNLKITIEKKKKKADDSYVVGWMGNLSDQGEQCRGAHNSCTGHCKGTHGGPVKNCKSHSDPKWKTEELDAPHLDYDSALEQLKSKQTILNELAKEGFGLSLVHGHNSQSTFTKLPKGYIAVISNGETSFRPTDVVENDPTFVPNVWRSVDGKIEVAGGHSQQ